MPIILECVLRAAGNETRTERERGTQKGRARGQSVRFVGIFRLLTGVCEMQILGVTIVTTHPLGSRLYSEGKCDTLSEKMQST